jgi:hypothetical protein
MGQHEGHQAAHFAHEYVDDSIEPAQDQGVLGFVRPETA